MAANRFAVRCGLARGADIRRLAGGRCSATAFHGDAIAGTFVDDLLDTVTAGFNLHLGAEYPVTPRFRIYTIGKYEVLSDLQYFQVRAGWQIMTGPNAQGEER